MEHLKNLEIKRLFKELEFVELDYIYQSELIEVSNNAFFEKVDSFLENFPELKIIFEEKTQRNVEVKTDVSVIELIDVEENEDVTVMPKEPGLKQMFRKVVKSTHPDKITNHKLNRLYLTANQAYENNNLPVMLQVCSELEIDINYGEYFDMISDRIKQFNAKMTFLKNTYTYKWMKEDNIENKNKILLDFIKTKVR